MLTLGIYRNNSKTKVLSIIHPIYLAYLDFIQLGKKRYFNQVNYESSF